MSTSKHSPEVAYAPGIGLVSMGDTTPREVVVPAKQETFEAQVLVITKPSTRMEYPFGMDMSVRMPFTQIERVIEGGRYRLDFVPSSLMGGKPTLILYEQDGDDEE